MEHELSHGVGYIPSARARKRVDSFLPHTQSLLRHTDLALTSNDPPPLSPDLKLITGRCWSPTPAALRTLRSQGVPLPAAPSLEVLQKVNHRLFCLELEGGAPGACYLQTDEELVRFLDKRGTRNWLFKRPFGVAGRDQRKVHGAELLPACRTWLTASIRKGGVIAEHWLDIVAEYCLHGLLSPVGQLTLGSICGQEVSPRQAWQQSHCPPEHALCPEDEKQLRRCARQVAQRLHQYGYFGPFGIDAYTYRSTTGSLHFNALSEVNARYCMGFAKGFAQVERWWELPGA